MNKWPRPLRFGLALFAVCFTVLTVPAMAAPHAHTDANQLWYAAGETAPTCDLKNQACPCKFEALVAALSRSWGKPVGRGGRAAAANLIALFRKQNAEGRVRQLVSLHDNSDQVASFAQLRTQRQLTVFGHGACVTQTVSWTPFGMIVLDFKQFALLSSVKEGTPLPPPRAPAPPAGH